MICTAGQAADLPENEIACAQPDRVVPVFVEPFRLFHVFHHRENVLEALAEFQQRQNQVGRFHESSQCRFPRCDQRFLHHLAAALVVALDPAQECQRGQLFSPAPKLETGAEETLFQIGAAFAHHAPGLPVGPERTGDAHRNLGSGVAQSVGPRQRRAQVLQLGIDPLAPPVAMNPFPEPFGGCLGKGDHGGGVRVLHRGCLSGPFELSAPEFTDRFQHVEPGHPSISPT